MLFRSVKGLQYDDWIMGLFVTTSYTVMIVLSNRWLKVGSNLEPVGFDFNALTADELFKRIHGSKLVVVVEQLHIAVLWSCKACLLVMYHRITRTAKHNENIAIKVLAVYTALGFVIIEVLYFAAWCRPFRQYYAVPTNSSQCNTLVHHRIVKAVFNISSDLIMLCIALQMLIRSLLPIKRKLILCGIFSLGIFVVAASIMNSYYSFSNPYKSTWIYWYVRESSTAILVANLPFTWTILREIFELGQFDETNPPPWTYHSSRTAGGRRTAQLLNNQGTTGVRTGTRRSPNVSTGSNSTGAHSMTLVGSHATKEHCKSPVDSGRFEDADKDFLARGVHAQDFAPAVLRTDMVNIDLETGSIREGESQPISPEYAFQRTKPSSTPPRVTQDGTGGFYVNDRPISPPPRVHFTAASNRSRDGSVGSSNRRPMSPASSYVSSTLNSRCASPSTQRRAAAHGAGGGRSAKDRRKRTKMSEH
ncbi:hypothetical protein PtrSN002B_001584 [Pyrenophora tritici-repentis]|nr:hypothetical protein PtrV1_04737 [Pyrenophora tritici-repentis]KAF7452439.1 hypothetical protein A1F99_042170 [Pyrenophora tritici-repentis]KAF7574443.1 hypothetical protein PtrM4_060660 [Pyrenophora tritici-repentis]KAI0581589.1 hypothetical protein Alg130_06524 [Pyrenophora tritici-repentis]KAI0587711.1 hypothetical protein Alg215_01293 [Pyrenophora tritici-repentis]